MAVKVSKETGDRAIGWLKNTTVAPEKIADYLGFHGDNRVRFLAFAKKYRKKLWDMLDAMTQEERAKWAKSQ